jgi:hypothetical protein
MIVGGQAIGESLSQNDNEAANAARQMERMHAGQYIEKRAVEVRLKIDARLNQLLPHSNLPH